MEPLQNLLSFCSGSCIGFYWSNSEIYSSMSEYQSFLNPIHSFENEVLACFKNDKNFLEGLIIMRCELSHCSVNYVRRNAIVLTQIVKL